LDNRSGNIINGNNNIKLSGNLNNNINMGNINSIDLNKKKKKI
jgi:hypothetical protein